MKAAICLIPGCKRERYSRGLCAACYRSARNSIKMRNATDNELVKAGLLLPRKKIYAARGVFQVALAKLKGPRK